MSHLFILRRATVLLVFASLAMGLVTSSDGSAFGPTIGGVPDADGAQVSKPTGARVSHRKRDQLPRQPDVLLGHARPPHPAGGALEGHVMPSRAPSQARDALEAPLRHSLSHVVATPDPGARPGDAAGAPRNVALVAFAPYATAAEVTAFLRDFAATIADGPNADGLYRLRFATSGPSVAKTIQSMRARKAIVVSITDA